MLLHLFFKLLTWMFLIGMVGSLIVITITTIQDLGEIFQKEKPAETPITEVAAD